MNYLRVLDVLEEIEAINRSLARLDEAIDPDDAPETKITSLDDADDCLDLNDDSSAV